MVIKKISEKTSGISLAGFQARVQPSVVEVKTPAPEVPVDSNLTPSPPLIAAPSSVRTAAKSFTGAGVFMAAITGKDDVSKELADVQAQLVAANAALEEFDGAEVARLFDPKCIKASKWANRSEESFLSPEFEALKQEIESAGGNVQPIKVRPLPNAPGEYEIVFGHRRHRACLELGISVLALIDQLDEVQLFTQMDRENRQRADLRPFEQGTMYARALDGGLFPSLRKLAEALGVDLGNASKAVTLARLPAQVLSAFASPLDLQQRWSTHLSAVLQKDPDIVLSRARTLAQLVPKPSAGAIFKELIGEGAVPNNTPNPDPVAIKGKGGKSGKISFNPKKQSFEISLTGIDKSQMKSVEQAIKGLLS
jgi:ParB family chromosome partitioning protein